MFGRATIRLGIGPHSSFSKYCIQKRELSNTMAVQALSTQRERPVTRKNRLDFVAILSRSGTVWIQDFSRTPVSTAVLYSLTDVAIIWRHHVPLRKFELSEYFLVIKRLLTEHNVGRYNGHAVLITCNTYVLTHSNMSDFCTNQPSAYTTISTHCHSQALSTVIVVTSCQLLTVS